MVRKVGWGIMLVLATLVAVYAFLGVGFPTLRSPFVADLLSAKALRTMGHLGAGGVAIVTGGLQFSLRLRFETPRVHRVLGRIYLVAVGISGVAGLLLAPTATGGMASHFGFGMLALLWVSTAALALVRVRAGDYAAHRAWMIRSYALCLAAVTLRLYLPISAIFGVPFESAYPAIAWLCWVPNLILAEWVLVPGSVAPLHPAGEGSSG